VDDAVQLDQALQEYREDRVVPEHRMSWAYIAGFFDGEGHIGMQGRGIQLSMAQSRKRGLEVLREIKEFLALHGVKSSTYINKNPEKCHSLWVTNRPDIRYLLNLLMPYLHVKKEEAQDHLRYITMFPAIKRGTLLGAAISEAKQRNYSAWRRKLSVEQVREIRSRLATEKDRDLSVAYGVHRNTIYAIRVKASWKRLA